MRLVEKHIIDKNCEIYKDIDHLCFLSKNLYNVGLYKIRQHFFNTRTFLNYEDLQKHLQDSKQVDYYALPTKVSQQILRTLCKNFKSFFKASEEYKKNPGKFKASPKLPKYKHKTKGRNIVQYPIDAISTPRENRVQLSMSNITISSEQKNIKQVRIVPGCGVHKIEIVYEKSSSLFCESDIGKSFVVQLQADNQVSAYLKGKFGKNLQRQIDKYDEAKNLSKGLKQSISDKLNSLLKNPLYDKQCFTDVKLSEETKQLLQHENHQGEKLIHLNRLLLEDAYPEEIERHETPSKTHKLEKDNVAGIDIGLDNLAAITSNQKDFKPVLINGRPLKSINQYYNKKRAKLMSFIGGKGTSKGIEKLTHKRNCMVENYLHQSSRYIIDLLVKQKIGTLIIGKNDGWKQDINIGKRNNQNFVSIPHAQFIHQLQYKGELAGIEVIVNEESYTSKCSFLDEEPIKKHKKYLGRRIKRGLFKSKNGTKINADINGSANIIRKVIPNAFANGIEGIVVFPKRLTPLKAKKCQM